MHSPALLHRFALVFGHRRVLWLLLATAALPLLIATPLLLAVHLPF